MTSALFSSIRLADLELANRVVVSPMCQYSADDGVASDWHLNHLGMLANSGAALVVAEATGIERRGRISHGWLGLYPDDCEAALARVVAHCRRYGNAKVGIQLAHAGRKASAASPWEGGQALGAGADPWETIAPSAIAFGPNWPVPRQMNAADMERVRNAFVDAARRAIRAGIDAIELHGAHGYLLHSFVSPVSNKRSDDYGGSLAARMRYPIEIAQAVRAVVPKGMPLGARITGSDWSRAHARRAVARQGAEAAGLDFICISSGGITAETRPTSVANLNVGFAEGQREAGIATRAVGLIATPKRAGRRVKARPTWRLARASTIPIGAGTHQRTRRRRRAPEAVSRAAPRMAGRGLQGSVNQNQWSVISDQKVHRARPFLITDH
jgi:NADPH2 dehydrogenase